MRIWRFCTLLFLCSLWFTAGLQAAAADYCGYEICEIQVRGNARTRDRVVRRIAGLMKGAVLDKEDLEQAKVSLNKCGLFAEAEIAVQPCSGKDDSAVTVILEVEDRWTLIPIPAFFTDGSSAVTGGLVVAESNLAGTGKTLVAGGVGGTEGALGVAVFVDPALLGSPFKLSLSVNGGLGDEVKTDTEGNRLLSARIRTAGASLGVGYQFTDRISASLGGRFVERDLDQVRGSAADVLELNTSQGEVSFSAGYDATVPYGALLKGYKAHGRAGYFLFEKTACADGSGSVNLAAPWNQRLRLLAAGGGGVRPFLAEKSVSGRDGFRTLPLGGVTAQEYWSTAAAYDVPVFSPDWGAVVLSGFYEHGWYRSEAVSSRFFYGAGGGFRVYLRKLAVPALGIDAAYNLASQRVVFSIALGMQV